MKKSFLYIVLMLLPLSFISCEQVSENYLQGKWKIQEVEVQILSGEEVMSSESESITDNVYITFSSASYESDLWGKGSYTLPREGEFVILDPNHVDYYIQFDVRKLGANKMELINTLSNPTSSQYSDEKIRTIYELKKEK